ncbi:MAG: hypothetical protein JWO91_1663 [Acidobacteriaceae bacterium]|nr:hypothetical protein [Acidobacteriaceae bacterium]
MEPANSSFPLATFEFPDSSKRPPRPQGGPTQAEEDTSLQRHYSIIEVAALWGLNEKTVRRIFAKEPGVIELGREESRFKRAYVTCRIPESVLRRVHRRLRKSA